MLLGLVRWKLSFILDRDVQGPQNELHHKRTKLGATNADTTKVLSVDAVSMAMAYQFDLVEILVARHASHTPDNARVVLATAGRSQHDAHPGHVLRSETGTIGNGRRRAGLQARNIHLLVTIEKNTEKFFPWFKTHFRKYEDLDSHVSKLKSCYSSIN